MNMRIVVVVLVNIPPALAWPDSNGDPTVSFVLCLSSESLLSAVAGKVRSWVVIRGLMAAA